MKRIVCCIVVMALGGCSSTGAWRMLRIDGGSQSSMDSSVASIQQELSPVRRERFDMVLADLWITASLNAEAKGAEYSESDYFALLDGLRYQDVIKLAGPEATPRYWAAAQAGQRRGAGGLGAWSGTDPYRFPTYVEPPPGLTIP